MEHVLPSLDNMLLLDRLASDAADEERQRIARDLHDSVIQGHIGLRMGLTSLCKRVHNINGSDGLAEDLDRLIQMTDMGIEDLRNYVAGLKASKPGEQGHNSSIERFVQKFTQASTIDVEVDIDPALKINDRLAAEVFQMIAEGLSNVRRHTNSRRARIQMERRDNNLELEISNEGATGLAASFTPRSIAGRAVALGGTAYVRHQD
jgi:signal transduction histidine kinase